MMAPSRPLARLLKITRHFQFRTMATDAKYYPIPIEASHTDSSLTFNHTCLRVKDPKRSIDFYESKFGMELIGKKEFPESKFDLYFLSFPKANFHRNASGDIDVFRNSGVLELTHNYGTENDPNFKINNGNEEPHRGFGHICFTVPDVTHTCELLESKGVAFKKRLTDGRQKDIAFALDPDGYWIELVQYNRPGSSDKFDVGYLFNHTMIRVKDAKKSLEFYQNVLGMHLLDVSEHANAKFTLYFLGYSRDSARWSQEGVLELTHNWGTEDDADFKYHNGNEQPQGYGHICVSLVNPNVLCKEIENKYGDKIQWAVKFNQGKMKNLAFIKDPDGYSIEILPFGYN